LLLGYKMKHKDYEMARDLKKRLSKIVNLIDFKIFGSRVRGDDDEYSDMDVFLEVESFNKGLKKKIRDIIWEIGFENSIYISPIIFTRHEVEKSPLKASSILKNIYEEGVSV